MAKIVELFVVRDLLILLFQQVVQHQEPRKNSPIKESLLGGCWLVRGGWTSINYFVVSLLNPFS
jgi:hypothetical protein